MKKNTRTLMITLISFIVIIVVASVAYNALKESSAPSVSLTPNLTNIPTAAEKTVAVAPSIDAVEEPAVATTSSAVDEPVATPPEATADEEADAPETEAAADAPAEEAPKMPDIPLFTLDGEETSFDAVRQGKPAIINYFASWCPPCKQELPHFQAAYDTYGDQISFIFLNAMDGQRETLETLTKFMEDFPFTGPVYTDEGIFAYIFQTNSLPTTVFFNADGSIANGYLGYVSETALQENIDRLLTQE
ncbi:redoxin family protein [Sphaerochaeta sp.]|uniref:TlpA family protein disulfide reductase n=1 Tax=Sphaerochaeta sp. TaxID=1972642 RepID=UPI003D0E60F3